MTGILQKQKTIALISLISLLAVVLASCKNSFLYQPSAAEIIRQGYSVVNSNPDSARLCIEQVAEDDVANLDDSTQFMYHFCAAVTNAKTKATYKDHLLKVKEIMETRIGIGSEEYFRALLKLGSEAEAENDLRAAEDYYNTGYVRAALYCHHPYLVYWYWHLVLALAEVHSKEGMEEVAEYLFEEAQDYAGEDSTAEYFVLPLIKLASHQMKWGKTEDALKTTDRRMELISENKGEYNEDYVGALYDKSGYLYTIGRYAEAVKAGREAMDKLEAADEYIPNPWKWKEMTLSNMLLCYASMGNYEEVDNLKEQYLHCSKEADEASQFCNTMYMAIEKFIDAGKNKEAKALCEWTVKQQMFTEDEERAAFQEMLEML